MTWIWSYSRIMSVFGITAVMLYSLLLTVSSVERTIPVTKDFTDVETPAAQHGMKILTGLYKSQDALRAWVVLGDEEFRAAKERAWSKDIQPSLLEIQRIFKDKQDEKALKYIAILEKDLNLLKKHQIQIQNMAHSPDNFPATKLFDEQVKPKLKEMQKIMIKIIDEEDNIEPTMERRHLMTKFAASERHELIADEHLNLFLDRGTEENIVTYQNALSDLSEDMDYILGKKALLTASQAAHIARYNELLELVDSIDNEVIDIRLGEHWNEASYMFTHEVAEDIARLEEEIGHFLAVREDHMKEEAHEVLETLESLDQSAWSLLWLSIIVTCFVVYILHVQLAGPIGKILGTLQKVKNTGNLGERIAHRSKDDVGQVVSHVNELLEMFQHVMQDLSKQSSDIGQLSSQLLDTSESLTNEAGTSAEKSSVISQAASTMASNIQLMDVATRDASRNVEQATLSVREMRDSVGEISRNTRQAATVARRASQLVEESNESMKRLNSNAETVESVVMLIDDIAEQTKTLALNASIESARAGEHGKSFAVVANEVKDLARETEQAVSEIRDKVEGIKGSVECSAKAMLSIGDVIGEINMISESIASAIEEQTVSTTTISDRMEQAMSEVTQVAQGVENSASSSQDISSSIRGVHESTTVAEKGAKHVLGNGRSLSRIAHDLQSSVRRFQV